MPTPRRAGRGRRGVASLALAAAALLVGAPSALADAYDDACGSPTTTIPASSSAAISVGASAVVLVAGGVFTGGVDSWATSGVICVAAGATFAPPYMNNAGGSLYSRGTVTMPATAVAGSFRFDNFGTATFPSSFNTNGFVTLINREGATWTMSAQFSSGARFENRGDAVLSGGFNQNSGGSVLNLGDLEILGGANLNDVVVNHGVMSVTGTVNINGTARLLNECRVRFETGLNNSGTVANGGHVELAAGTTWQNNGSYTQAASGLTTGANMTNNNAVTGLGRYRFTGTTVTQGTFSGTSSAAPIIFQDTTPTGSQIFDVQNGTISNVVAGVVDVTRQADLPFGCAAPPVVTADVSVTATGPAEIAAGGTITYKVLVANHGPNEATGVVVEAAVDAAITGIAASDGGAVNGSTIEWTVGAVAAGASLTFTVTGTAPAAGTLLTVVSGTSTSDDPIGENNDGSQDLARVTTTIAVPPVNNPPVVDDIELTGTATTRFSGVIPFSDPDPGQTASLALTVPPPFGTAIVLPNGIASYDPESDFVGVVTAEVTACDDGTPVLCSTATVTITYVPIAVDDSATTTEGVPVNGDPLLNDVGDVGPPVIILGPANGTAVVEPDGTVTYTPDPGFVGTDAFDYEICGPVDLDVCDQATVTIVVGAAPNEPPVVGDASLAIPAETTGSGSVTVTDPDTGQTVTATLGAAPGEGAAIVDPAGGFQYSPSGSYTGRDTFTIIGCDDGVPVLCATGTVSVAITPVAMDDDATTTTGVAVTVDVEANDVGDIGSPVIVVGPTNGTAVVGSIIYTPNAGYVGPDVLTYEVCSPNDQTLCDRAELTIDVTAAPPASPTATPTPTSTPTGSAAPTDSTAPTATASPPTPPPTDSNASGAARSDAGSALSLTLLASVAIGSVLLARRRGRRA